jgi:hypothetical protein
MTLLTTSENTNTRHTDIQLTLSLQEAERLRITLPWLLHALADRPTTAPQQRERRHKAHAALEHLLSALSNQLQQVEEDRESQ